MSWKTFLFGNQKNGETSLSDKIKSGAKSRLDSKIIRNPLNAWWIVLVRQYLLYPLIKLPLIPADEMRAIRPKFISFSRAVDLMQSNGIGSTKVDFIPSRREWASAKTLAARARLVATPLISIFWRPRGHPLAAERHLTLKLFFVTSTAWAASMALFAASVARIFSGDAKVALRDFARLFRTLDIPYAFSASGSEAFRLWAFGVGVWLFSLFVSILLSTRAWLRLSDQVKTFLKENGFKEDEIEGRSIILALPDTVFLSIPSAAIHRIRLLQTGWPGGFLPGEIYENLNNPSELLLMRRPQRDPIIFGGPHTRSDIKSHLAAYEKGIVSNLTSRMKTPDSPEHIFLGEVIDPRWWQSSHIYMPLSTNPHVVVVGQTRSGKSKGVLSFVYSFARAYPDTQWYFADGKGSPDYDPFADFLSEYPVAKPDEKGDPLVQFANLVDVIWTELGMRQRLFEEARMAGKPCSTIYQYRELVGPLNQVWFVVDEFSVFFMEMDFDTNFKTSGTIANRLKRITAEAASYGIHLLIASQRYQNSDVPTPMRANLVARMIYNVQPSDASFLGVDDATKLETGQAYTSASGLYCKHTGLNIIKTKLPYIGDKPDTLLSQTIKPIAREKKKTFDPFLIYNKGSSDLDDMSIPEFCVRLHKFFRDQNYIVEDLDKDPEAIEMQMHIRKGRRRELVLDDGSTTIELEPAGDPPIGVSILRGEELDEDTLLGIQDKYGNYPTIIVFVMGKNINSQKYRFVKDLNEKGARFFIYPSTGYRKDFKYVEMKRRQGITVDLVRSKLERFGLADVSHEVAAKNLTWEEISKKSPMRLRVSKILETFSLETSSKESDSLRGVPYVSTVLPGGTELFILIVSDKGQRDDAKSLAEGFHQNGAATIIVTDEKFSATDLKVLGSLRAIVWRSSQIDEWVTLGKDGRLGGTFMSDMIKSLGIVSDDKKIAYGRLARLTLSCELNQTKDGISLLKIGCDVTGYNLMSCRDMPLEHYRLDELGIPESAKIVLLNGMAPAGVLPENVKTRYSSRGGLASLPVTSKWEVHQKVLRVRQSSISDDDPTLLEMRGKTPNSPP